MEVYSATLIANEKNLFLCACDLNNRIIEERRFKSNIAMIGEPQFYVPTRSGERWRASQRYTYGERCINTDGKTKKYSFVWSEGETWISCMNEFNKAYERILVKVPSIYKECSIRIFRPTNNEKKWQAYMQYAYDE